ncbi:unnamed protein product, partial [Heterobilharzia americana]
MNHFPVITLIFTFIVLPNLIASQTIETKTVPFSLTENGDMVIEISGVKYTLDNDLSLKVDEGNCWTKIDFSRPSKAEKETGKGSRNITA